MDALSKVTRYVRDVYEGLQQGAENAEPQAHCSAAKKELEFEHLDDTCIPSANGHTAVPEKVLVLSLLYSGFVNILFAV